MTSKILSIEMPGDFPLPMYESVYERVLEYRKPGRTPDHCYVCSYRCPEISLDA